MSHSFHAQVFFCEPKNYKMENVNALEEIQALEKKAEEALRRKQEHLKTVSEQARRKNSFSFYSHFFSL